jgi:DNA repair photolyase
MTEFIWVTEMCDPTTKWDPIAEKIESGLPIVLYTKAAVPLDILMLKRKNFAICYTITGWGGTWLERGVPNYLDMIKHFNGSASMLGERVSLRVDPVIPTEEGFEKALSVIAHINRPVRIVSSILQLYTGHAEMAKKLNIDLSTYTVTSQRAKYVRKDVAQDWVNRVTKKFGWTKGRLQMCGMPYDLEGVTHTGCLNKEMLDSIGVVSFKQILEGKQRPGCKCIIAKRQLIAGSCVHGCLYCYAHKENLRRL